MPRNEYIFLVSFDQCKIIIFFNVHSIILLMKFRVALDFLNCITLFTPAAFQGSQFELILYGSLKNREIFTILYRYVL